MAAGGGCDFCDAAANLDRCARCGRLLCAEHVPVGRARCGACESEFREARDRLSLWPWFLVPFVLLLGVFFAFSDPSQPSGRLVTLTGSPVLDGFLVASFYAVCLGGGAVHLRKVLHRRRFLAERPKGQRATG